MARFTIDDKGRVVVVELPEKVRPIHRNQSRASKRAAFIPATLPDGRVASVLVDVLITQRDGSRSAIVHYGKRLWANAMERLARRNAVDRAFAELMYRVHTGLPSN